MFEKLTWDLPQHRPPMWWAWCLHRDQSFHELLALLQDTIEFLSPPKLTGQTSEHQLPCETKDFFPIVFILYIFVIKFYSKFYNYAATEELIKNYNRSNVSYFTVLFLFEKSVRKRKLKNWSLSIDIQFFVTDQIFRIFQRN